MAQQAADGTDIRSAETALTFGQRMADLRKRGEIPEPPRPGRKPIAEKYRKQIDAMHRVFADSLPDLAKEYMEDVRPHAPERCPDHDRVLTCPEDGCKHISQRRMLDHRAAAYAIDRIVGKPTSRSENAITVTTMQQFVMAVVGIFGDVNALADPATRQVAFASRCAELGLQFDSSAA